MCFFKAVNHSHEPGLSESRSDFEIEETVDSIMREMDLNGDGVIDWIEYVKQDDGA